MYPLDTQCLVSFDFLYIYRPGTGLDHELLQSIFFTCIPGNHAPSLTHRDKQHKGLNNMTAYQQSLETSITHRKTFEDWFENVYKRNPKHYKLRQSLSVYGSPNLVTNAIRCLNKGKALPVK
jgi:hypothetical protein